MSTSYATILQQLCHDYMNHHMSFEEYRRRRKQLLIKIDEQFNGASVTAKDQLTSPGLPSNSHQFTRNNSHR